MESHQIQENVLVSPILLEIEEDNHIHSEMTRLFQKPEKTEEDRVRLADLVYTYYVTNIHLRDW